jgi:hypothetical protein
MRMMILPLFDDGQSHPPGDAGGRRVGVGASISHSVTATAAVLPAACDASNTARTQRVVTGGKRVSCG